MSPARGPRPDSMLERLLLIDPAGGGHADATVADLARLLRAGDALVVNDAGTLPASLPVDAGQDGAVRELRLLGLPQEGKAWQAVLFGEGDWRVDTELRPAPAAVSPGDVLTIGDGLSATIEAVSPLSARLVTLRFDRDGDALWAALYRYGSPIRYSYLSGPVPLGKFQTRYAARPWAAEMPSAGRPLPAGLLALLRARGVAVLSLTHAAGISSTGDPAIDASLPLPERFEIPAETVEAIERVKAAGGRVIAAGTSVVRALEGSAAGNGGRLAPGRGVTGLRLGPGSRLAVVDGLLTGLHEPTASHFTLLQAFCPLPVLSRAYAHAERERYLYHEFGDSCLIAA